MQLILPMPEFKRWAISHIRDDRVQFAKGARGLLALGLILSGCSDWQKPASRERDVLVRIAEDDGKGLDPQSYSDLASTRIAAEQFEGLTRFSAKGAAEPGLAARWSQSSDGLAWRFTLRSGLHFSDGAPITAQTFADVFARLNDSATASPQKGLFEAIESITAPDRLAVEIRLRHPFPALPDLLAHPAIAALPLHLRDWPSARPMVVSGPYRVTQWALNDRLRLEANPAWHDGVPSIRHVDWRPISDSLVALRLFQSGGADTIGELPSTRLPHLRQTMSDQLHIAPFSGAYYFAFNTRRAPFNDPRVRLALSMAVERDWMAKSLIATGVQPAWGIIPPGTTGLNAYRPIWSGWDRAHRLAAALKLLAAAGYGAAHPLRFEMRFNSDTDHRRVSVALAAMWRPLGVEAALLNSEASLHFASLRRGDFALARSGWIGDIPVPENYLAVHESNGGVINYSGFSNKSYDAALAAALAMPDATARARAMRRAEAVLMDQSPILPLYFYVSKSMVAPRVKGWSDNAANVHPSRTLRVQ